VHGEFQRGQQATSVLLESFTDDVSALFSVANDVGGIGLHPQIPQ
jgi:hypothetical protein